MPRFSVLIALGLVILGSGPAGPGPDPKPAGVLSRLAVQRRDAARKTYEVLWANRAPDEVLYRWSLRWLDAERQLGKQPADQVAALRGHWERMKEMEKILESLQQSGLTTVDQVSAVEFYRAEAELWLLQAKQEGKGR